MQAIEQPAPQEIMAHVRIRKQPADSSAKTSLYIMEIPQISENRHNMTQPSHSWELIQMRQKSANKGVIRIPENIAAQFIIVKK